MEIQELEFENWKTNRKLIKNNYTLDENWILIINSFKSSIDNHYLNPIKTLIEKNNLIGEGFTILIIECVLIEFFASLKTGEIYQYGNKTKKKYYYNDSKKLFINFLKNEPLFSTEFNQNSNFKYKVSSKQFYSEVRCGLLHEAFLKNKWIINARENDLNETENIDNLTFLSYDKGNNIINRTLLFLKLEKYFNNYINELKSEHNTILRKNLGRKLDHMLKIKLDKSYNWWN